MNFKKKIIFATKYDLLILMASIMSTLCLAQEIPNQQIAQYLDCFLTKKPANDLKVSSSLFGRVLKGKSDLDFKSFTNDPKRKLIFVMGEEGLSQLLNKSTDQIFDTIGYTSDYVKRLKSEGFSFKLFLFDHSKVKPQLATWDHVIDLVKIVYPELAPIFEKAKLVLKERTIQEFEKQAGYLFAETDKLGESDPRFMTEEKLKNSDGEPWKVRAFLYHRARLMELFRGDGYTQSKDSKKKIKEYVIPNQSIELKVGVNAIEL